MLIIQNETFFFSFNLARNISEECIGNISACCLFWSKASQMLLHVVYAADDLNTDIHVHDIFILSILAYSSFNFNVNDDIFKNSEFAKDSQENCSLPEGVFPDKQCSHV